jgi:hypothetical protein
MNCSCFKLVEGLFELVLVRNGLFLVVYKGCNSGDSIFIVGNYWVEGEGLKRGSEIPCDPCIVDLYT